MILMRFHSTFHTEIPYGDGAASSIPDALDVCTGCLGQGVDPNKWPNEHWSEDDAEMIRYADRVEQLETGACSVCGVDKVQDELRQAGPSDDRDGCHAGFDTEWAVKGELEPDGHIKVEVI